VSVKDTRVKMRPGRHNLSKTSWTGHYGHFSGKTHIKKLETTDMTLDSLKDDPTKDGPNHRTQASNGAANNIASQG